MAEHSSIEWTDATWNPITGCSVVSPGCTNCYAMKLAGTRLRHHPSREGLTNPSKAGPAWNGKVRLNEAWLAQPLDWKRPCRIFVCAHGDLFHDAVPEAWIDKVFAVMALAPWHTFQVLTKRSRRMREFVSNPGTPGRVYDLACDMALGEMAGSASRAKVVLIPSPGFEAMAPAGQHVRLYGWPLPNVWLGVSAEDQARADERIPDLVNTPAHVRFVSLEPLLGPIALDGQVLAYLDWVIVGGESGLNARPMHPDWARILRDQCQVAGVPFFFKQWGEWAPWGFPGQDRGPSLPWKTWTGAAWSDHYDGRSVENTVARLGKKRAGRLLDGIEHNAMPGAKS